MNKIINAIGHIRTEVAAQYEKNMTREVSLVLTKLDEAMLWAGVQDLKEQQVNGNEDATVAE